MKTFSTAEMERRARLLSKLFVAFRATSDRPTVEVYFEALSDISTDSLERTVEQFVKGRIARRSNDFVPTTAELTVAAQSWEDVLHPAAKAPVKLLSEDKKISPAEAKRVRAGLMKLAGKLGVEIERQRTDEEDRRRAKLRERDARFLEADPRPLAERLKLERFGLRVDEVTPAE